jgi:hypothetical protein
MSDVSVAKIGLIGTLGVAVIGGIVTLVVEFGKDDPPEDTNPVQVAGVALDAETTSFYVQCPITVAFTGTIDVESGTGDVVYRWLRTDGFNQPTSVGERQRISVDGPGSVSVTDEWTANVPFGDVARTNVLEMLEPENLRSESVVVSGRCDSRLPEGPAVPPPQVPGGPPG